MERRWFQFHLSTAMILMVVAGAVLGMNMTRRAELNQLPARLKIGVGGEAVQVTAHSMRTYIGWPLEWERDNVDRWYAQLTSNIAAAVGILLLTATVCEVWTRRMAQHLDEKAVRILGVRVQFLAWLGVAALAAVICWNHMVLVPDGPLATRGWPLQWQAFLRADAVIDGAAIAKWRRIERGGWTFAAGNAGFLALGFVVIFGAARWYIWRATEGARKLTP
jgi:hypothetical protein